MNYGFDAELAAKECIEWIREWFEENGPNCNVVIGISGGKDSSVVAALCVEALGKDRVYGVMMPNGYQSDLADAAQVCKVLGIKNATIYINDIFAKFIDEVKWANIAPSEQTKINLAPRIRMTMLYAISQSINGRVACTDNLSESFIGYSTRWGDNVGDFAPLASLTSEEVVAIGDALGLPYELTHKTPADGLCGKTDEDNFGFTYEQLNNAINFCSCGDEEVDEKIFNLHERNSFKKLDLPKYRPSSDVYK